MAEARGERSDQLAGRDDEVPLSHGGRWFDELVASTSEPLLSYVRRQCGSDYVQQAEDILQEVFARAYVQQAALENHPNRVGWLYRTAQNLLHQLHRGEKRESGRRVELRPPTTLEDVAGDTGEDLIDLVDDPRSIEHLQRLVERLPTTHREVLRLTIAQHTPAQIAEALGITENAAKIRLTRARAHLRHVLARQ